MFQRIAKILPVALFCMTAGTAWAAQSPFIGDWKLDPSRTRLPDEMKVASKGGHSYAFDFGGATETIAVDGSFQPGYGGTLLSAKTDAPDTWTIRRKQDSRLLLRATWKLSKDGNTLRDYFRQFDPDGSTLSIDYVYRRAGAGSGFAGDWKSIQETMNSSYTMQVKAYQGGGLSLVTPSRHATKNLIFDGKDHPKAAPNAFTAAKRIDARTLAITDKAGGSVLDTQEIALSADLKTLTMTVHIPGRDQPNVMVFERS